MKSVLIRTAALTSLATALVVSGISYVAMPKVFGASAATPEQQQLQPYNGVTLVPANYNGPMQPAVYAPQGYQAYPVQAPAPRVYRPAVVRRTAASAPVYEEPVYQPAVRQKRSTAKSVMIVGGSAAAGAGIGALTGGKKGAAIGAISGGVAGLIYDRMTANPKQ
jgi:hypothetical protein